MKNPPPAAEEDFVFVAQKRAVIFANGILNYAGTAHALIQPGDLVIAADGGGRHCRALGISPDVLIGDFDSLDEEELDWFREIGSQIIRHPAEKDFTDLELALKYARQSGAVEAFVIAALGARWDQTLANLLLPAAVDFQDLRISIVDGPQEVLLLRGGSTLEVRGYPDDTVSLIPIAGDAQGINTQGLVYPLRGETLYFGATRGVSNELVSNTASVSLENGMLLCVVIHNSWDQAGEGPQDY